MRTFVSVWIVLTIASSYAEIPSEMQSLMDHSVDPCDDFYQHACGGWLKTNPSYTGSTLVFDQIQKKNDEILREIVEENHPLLRSFWESCMNVDKTSDFGVKPLENDLRRIHKAETKLDLMALAGEFSRTGTNAFVKASIKNHPTDSTTNTLFLTPADCTLSVFYYSKHMLQQVIEPHREYINEVLRLSRFPYFEEKSSVSVSDIVIDIEQKLANFLLTRRRQLLLVSIKDAKQRWPHTVGAFLNGAQKINNVKEELIVYVRGINYLDFAENVIESVTVEELKVYLVYVMVHSRLHWLEKEYSQVRYNYFNQDVPDRKTICKDHLLKYAPDLIGGYYYDKAFDRQRHRNAARMFKFIKQAMGLHIVQADWMDPLDQKKAKTKLKRLMALIGQPKSPKTYPTILSGDDYPTNIYNILSHTFKEEMKKMGQPVNRTEWNVRTTDVNAYYNLGDNRILFPAGVLQPPLFNGANVHPAHNFGAIGTFMGHELSHGFDNRGRYYDGNGNVRPWWNESTINAYTGRAKCFENQYSKFHVNGEQGVIGSVNGVMTLNENIADNAGVAIAWDAYKRYMLENKPDTKGLSTPEGDQMFFLAFGQTWCAKRTDANMKHLFATDRHSPHQWRVNGVVMNNEDFATVFNCKANTPMNPTENKCKLW